MANVEQQEPENAENAFDSNTFNNSETPADQLGSSENNLQVSFSEPVATDSRLSANDNEDGAKSEPPKSILKGTASDKNRIFEHELDPSIMIRMTSPAESEKTPTKPTMARRSADLRQVLDIWQVAFLGSHRAE